MQAQTKTFFQYLHFYNLSSSRILILSRGQCTSRVEDIKYMNCIHFSKLIFTQKKKMSAIKNLINFGEIFKNTSSWIKLINETCWKIIYLPI